MRVTLITALAACSAPATNAVGPLGHATTSRPWDRVVLVTTAGMGGSSYTPYTIEGAALHALAPVNAGSAGDYGPTYGAWADHDNLILAFGFAHVVRVTSAGPATLAIPPEQSVPRPDVDGAETLAPDHAGILAVPAGEAWWSRCAWGFPNDGFQCQVFDQQQLWPTYNARRGPAPLAGTSFEWPDRAPAGFSAKVAADAVTCTARDGSVTAIPTDRAFDDEQPMAAHWISAAPPRLLVIFGQPGSTELRPNRWSLHDGCSPAPLETGSQVQPGPGNLWAATTGDADHATTSIRRGTQTLGTVPIGAWIMFRP